MSTPNRLAEAVFVIQHMGHGSTRIEDHRHGGQHHRFLNVTGRWAARGTRAVPLLAWTDHQEAQAAATIAGKARGRTIQVSSLGGNSLAADHFVTFCEHHATALLGYLPYSTAATKKLEDLRVKTVDCAGAMLRVHHAEDEEKTQILKDEGRRLLQAHRVTVFSAAQFLTGKKADEIIVLLETGELDFEGKLSVEELREAVQLAKSYGGLLTNGHDATGNA